MIWWCAGIVSTTLVREVGRGGEVLGGLAWIPCQAGMLALLCDSFQQDVGIVGDVVGNAKETKMGVCSWTFIGDGGGEINFRDCKAMTMTYVSQR